MIVGNKKDQEENRVVEMTEAAKFAQENGKCHILSCCFIDGSMRLLMGYKPNLSTY
jgi:hypothetical protein